MIIVWSEPLSGGQVRPDSTDFELCLDIIFVIVIITGMTGIPLLLFIFPAFMCTVYFIVAGQEPVEKIVGRGAKV